MSNTIPTTAQERNVLRRELNLRKLLAETEAEEMKTARLKAQASAARIYTFYGEVGPDTIRACMGELGVWSREYPGAPLTVIFNSPGGTVTDGLALFDYLLHLRSLGHNLTTIALGEAASMGGVLLQAGDDRVVGPNAMLLIHEVSAGTEGKVSQMADDLKLFKVLQEKLLKILAKRSKLTTTNIKRRWKKTDWWLDAQQAITLGFADSVLTPEFLTNQPEEPIGE
jgi:ATP-dependent Clp endopeptidase proteolytic subunit ClpP